MLSDYRMWLESELKLLANASHHAYSFGQANMAKRAIERFDQELAGKVAVLLPHEEAADLLAALDRAVAEGATGPSTEVLRAGLAAALHT